MTRSTPWLFSACLLTLGAGCSALVDGTLAGRGSAADAGMDAASNPADTGLDGSGPEDTGPDSGPLSPCQGMPLGLHCTITGIDEPFVCVDDICVLSRCGDGAVDGRTGSMHVTEQCDDGNSIPGDGCESDCTFSCDVAADCDDGEFCTGTETCESSHRVCTAGTAETDGTPCAVAGTSATCHSGVCRAGVCGDGNMDAGEECDDHNLNDHDGCDADCTFTCVDDSQCQDTDACNGSETCTVATHTCVAATSMLACDDADPCTTDSCNTTTGCVNTSILVDVDMDGYASSSGGGGACGGTDCNDSNGGIHPGATEPCGSATDLNCDGTMGAMTTYYRDCDNDNYAANATGSMMACSEPAAVTGCTGGWTSIAPGTGTTDCLDTSVGASVHPGQTMYFSSNVSGLAPSYDYNCSGAGTQEYPTSPRFDVAPSGHYSTACSGIGRNCTGAVWYVASSPPACGSTTATLSVCSGTLTCTRTTRTGVTVFCH